MPLVASLSGIRGTVPDSLNSATIRRFVAAFSEISGSGVIVIGRDGRPSGSEIMTECESILSEMGHDVVDIGIVPTPTVQMEILRRGAAGGIAISASHNPAEWNGLKFLGPSSMFLSPDLAQTLIRRAQHATPTTRFARGRIERAMDAIDEHVSQISGSRFFDLPSIRSKRFHVVVDAVNAGGSVAIPHLLEAFGCTVTRLYCDGTGRFPHTAEPLPQHLGDLCDAVRRHGADLGVAVDPDSDRLVLITEEGVPFGEEYTIVECIDAVLRLHSGTPVVANLSTTRAVDDVAAQYNSPVVRTPVGEINVAIAMQTCGALIGGEGSGGVILGPIHFGRDALVGCALTLQNLATLGGTASSLRALYPSYAIVKHKIDCADLSDGRAKLERIATHFEGERLRTDDGVHVTFSNGDWLHARTSNTEPILRMIAESTREEEARRIVEECARASG